MGVMEILKKALKEGVISQEDFDSAKSDVESKKYTEEDLNKAKEENLSQDKVNEIVREKVNKKNTEIRELKDELETYKKDAETYKAKTEELSNQLSEVNGKIENYTKEEKNRKINEKVNQFLGDRKLPEIYKKMINFETEDDEALKQNIEEVINTFKNDLKATGIEVGFGGASNPSNGATDLNTLSVNELFKIGLSK